MSSCCCTKESCCKPIVPTAKTTLTAKDIWGACKVRFGIGRMNYKVEPGIYAVGKPDKNSPVLVSANYKLTFDILRSKLSELDCWLLILDTKGVNVWCAAGKKTFGTDELVNRIETVKLSEIVAHRKLLLPQLGAPGVSAHEIKRRTGFLVMFGPVRANDIKTFISSGYKATKEMRTVKFTFWDRFVLTPVELVEVAKNSLPVFGVLFLLNLFAAQPFGIYDLAIYAVAAAVGAFLTPVLLPFIPGRAFSWKGWILGLICTALVLWNFGWFSSTFLLLGIGYMLLSPAFSAFLAMNFTGASTYTSPSGVLKEMKIALPFIVGAAVVGTILVIIGRVL